MIILIIISSSLPVAYHPRQAVFQQQNLLNVNHLKYVCKENQNVAVAAAAVAAPFVAAGLHQAKHS